MSFAGGVAASALGGEGRADQPLGADAGPFGGDAGPLGADAGPLGVSGVQPHACAGHYRPGMSAPDPTSSDSVPDLSRARWVRLGVWCTAFTLVWNIAEGVVAVWAGELANSVALVGFGVNSFVETASAAVIAWRLWAESRGDAALAHRAERTAGKWMGALLLVLALYLAFESARRLAGFGTEAHESRVGLALTALSLMVMPGLYLMKQRVARALNSAAVRADGVQTLTCFWLSVATFLGLLLNAWRGWGWADPAAALALVPLILKEARSAWKGEGCGCAGHAGCAASPG